MKPPQRFHSKSCNSESPKNIPADYYLGLCQTFLVIQVSRICKLENVAMGHGKRWPEILSYWSTQHARTLCWAPQHFERNCRYAASLISKLSLAQLCNFRRRKAADQSAKLLYARYDKQWHVAMWPLQATKNSKISNLEQQMLPKYPII